MKDCCRSSLKFLGAMLLAGCCIRVAAAENWQISNAQETTVSNQPRMASLIYSSDLAEPKNSYTTPHPRANSQGNKYWTFPNEDQSGPVLQLPAIVRLPPTTPSRIQNSPEEHILEDDPVASLLAPQAMIVSNPKTEETFVAPEAPSNDKVDENEDLSAEEHAIVAAVIGDRRAVTTGVLTDQRINQQAQMKIRRAYAMAGRGAYYASRQELIEVLRMISLSKDAEQGKAKQTLDLAAGLRALQEAEDFAPRGTQLEADLAIDVICASHRTPVARQIKSNELLPRQMMDCYFRYAQLKLASAVKDEPAGSMALHALGKLNSRLNRVEPEKHRLAHRLAVAFQQAALLAHDQNHLAAHELAVLLADSGHYAEAEQLLKQVVGREPNAIVYRNLARVQEKMGQSQQAATNRDYAQQLVQRGAGGPSNVQWVSPQDFSRMSGNSTRFASTTSHPPSSPAPAPNWR